MADRKFCAPAPAHALQPARRGQPHPGAGRADEEARHERRAPSPTTATCTARSSSTASARRAASTRSSATRRTSRPAQRTEREAAKRGEAGLAPHAAREERDRLQEPHQDVVDRVPRGLLLRPAHRQGDARGAQRRAHLPERLRRGRVQRVHPARTSTEEAEKLAEWFRKLFGDDFYVEIQNNGLDMQDQCTPGAVGHRRQARPAARGHQRRPLPVRRTTRSRTTCCCASTPARSTTRASSSIPKSGCPTSSTSAARRRCTGSSPATRTRSRAARRSPTASTSSSTSRSGTSRSSRRRTARRRRSTCASCASRG